MSSNTRELLTQLRDILLEEMDQTEHEDALRSVMEMSDAEITQLLRGEGIDIEGACSQIRERLGESPIGTKCQNIYSALKSL